MSTRGFGVPALSVVVLVLTSLGGRAAAQSRPPATQPQQNGSNKKTVVNALRELYTIPRDTRVGRSATQSSPRKTTKVSRINGGIESPRDPVSAPHRLGLQHADAIANSASSLPIGADPNAQPGGVPNAVTRDTLIEERAQLNELFENSETAQRWGPYDSRAYYRAGPRRSQRSRDRTNYRYFGGQPGRYGYGRRYAPYHYDSSSGDAFRFGFVEGFNRGRFERVAIEREQSVLEHHSIHLNRGLDHFHKGEYQQAAAAFKLAADTHHGDPAARIYAGHTLFAVGQYQQAITYLRRAFELQPKIALLDYDVRDDYPQNEDFNKHLAALDAAIKQSPNDTNRLLLLGYVRYYTGQRDKAYALLARADKINRGDGLAQRLMEHCQPPDVLLEK